MWFIDQIEQLMDMMDEETCAEDDMEKIIAWWVHSALKEAGASYAMAISSESDFCELIENVFLAPDSDCIEMLEDKRNTVLKFHRLQADLPSTMSNCGASGSHRLKLNSTESVVALLTPTPKNNKDNSTGAFTQCLQFMHDCVIVFTFIFQQCALPSSWGILIDYYCSPCVLSLTFKCLNILTFSHKSAHT
jgi:hypothetical protein